MGAHRDKNEKDDVQRDKNGDVTQMSGDLGPGADDKVRQAPYLPKLG